uniref:Niban apoptosis regulator 1 n=1 Tax=Suricata suricatta TaxID=37032 RepID=A0A673TY11_SURSU
MGGSASSLLDEGKCAYIRGKTEATIKNFSPFYSRQYSVAFCNHVRSEVEQQRDLTSQFLKTKPPLEPGTVLYEAELSQFAEDIKKWKERYIVVKNDFAVESYENKEAYQRGAAPKSRILPAGGMVLTSEDEYNLLSDRFFPDPLASSEKELAQPLVVMPKEFPVYLWQPFLRHGYFCFHEAAEQKKFSALLSDCIRHLNHDYMKQTTFEAQAFLEAVQFFRQETGHYGSWEMIIGDEVQILSNLVMDKLLPTLQRELLPKMKGKKNDRKRAWLGLLEEAYKLVQHQVSEGLSALKEECRSLTKNLEGTIRSDMDQIMNSKNFLTGKIKAMVAQPAERSCTESVQPFLASILEELMGPVSSGFSEVRSLFEKEVDELSQNFQTTKDSTQLKEHLDRLMNLPLDSVKMEPCYIKVNLLQERLQGLNSHFRFPHVNLVVQRTQNYMQEELQKYEQFIFADHTNMIHVENVYEEILHQRLLDETLKVIKEAAILKKHNLFEDNMALPSESVSSLTDLKTPAGSNQSSPATLPGVSDNETPSNEVFQESGGKKQPEAPSPLAQEESLSLPVAVPPPGENGQVAISGTDGPVVDLVAAEDTTGALGTCSPELEFRGAPEDGQPTQEKPESNSASASLKELRNLLTVTIEVPVDSATLEIEKDTNEETPVPQEIEELEETTQICTEASPAGASGQHSCEENEVSEGEARSPPPEAEAGGVELGGFLEAQLTCEGLAQGASSPSPTEQQAEAREPAESELTGRASRLDGQAASTMEGEARADHTCPGDSQVSVEKEGGGDSTMAQASASVDAEQVKAAGVPVCQWVVENAPNVDLPDSQDVGESTPEPPSEE